MKPAYISISIITLVHYEISERLLWSAAKFLNHGVFKLSFLTSFILGSTPILFHLPRCHSFIRAIKMTCPHPTTTTYFKLQGSTASLTKKTCILLLYDPVVSYNKLVLSTKHVLFV